MYDVPLGAEEGLESLVEPIAALLVLTAMW